MQASNSGQFLLLWFKISSISKSNLDEPPYNLQCVYIDHESEFPVKAVVKQEYPGAVDTSSSIPTTMRRKPRNPIPTERKVAYVIGSDLLFFPQRFFSSYISLTVDINGILLQDDKYWKRRVKNNLAAKRSREAKREKENQLSMRAQFLEREHRSLA